MSGEGDKVLMDMYRAYVPVMHVEYGGEGRGMEGVVDGRHLWFN